MTWYISFFQPFVGKKVFKFTPFHTECAFAMFLFWHIFSNSLVQKFVVAFHSFLVDIWSLLYQEFYSHCTSKIIKVTPLKKDIFSQGYKTSSKILFICYYLYCIPSNFSWHVFNQGVWYGHQSSESDSPLAVWIAFYRLG